MVNEDLATEVKAQLFLLVEWKGLAARLMTLLDFVSLVRYEYDHGPLRQALLLCLKDPIDTGGRPNDGNDRIAARIELRDGIVYAFCISGAVTNMECVLDIVGRFLTGSTYDEGAFQDHEHEINGLLAVRGELGRRLHVTFETGAGLSIYPYIDGRMACKIALAALNALRHSYGMDHLTLLPQFLQDHFTFQVSSPHPASTGYRESLDPQALSLAQHRRRGGETPLGELAVYNYFACGDSVKRRNRRQAAIAFPLLLPLLIWPSLAAGRNLLPASQDAVQRVGRITDSVDAGLPLFKAVAQAYTVPTESVRWLVHKELPLEWGIDDRRIGLLLHLISWVPTEKRPCDTNEFALMLKLGRALSVPLQFGRCDGDDTDVDDPRCSLVMRRWFSDLLRRRDLSGAGPDESALERNLADSKDFLEMLYLGLRARCHSVATTADEADDYLRFVLDWARTQSLVQFLALSRRWHASLLRTAEHPVAEAAQPTAWPTVLPQPANFGAFTVSELVDVQSLFQEGQLMQHCVATYGDHCIRRDGLVFSIRGEKGACRSTAQLKITSDKLGVAIVQHRGRGNGPAPQECVEVANLLVGLLNQPAQAELLRRRQLFQRRNRLQHRCAHLTMLDKQSASSRLAQSAAVELIAPGPLPVATISLPQLYAMTGVHRAGQALKTTG